MKIQADITLTVIVRESEPSIAGIHRHLEEMENRMNEQIAKLVQEVAETKGQNESILVFIRGVPAVIQAAVDKALADNPGLTAEDFAAVTQASVDLNDGQQEIAAAIEANSGTGTVPPVITVEG